MFAGNIKTQEIPRKYTRIFFFTLQIIKFDCHKINYNWRNMLNILVKLINFDFFFIATANSPV